MKQIPHRNVTGLKVLLAALFSIAPTPLLSEEITTTDPDVKDTGATPSEETAPSASSPPQNPEPAGPPAAPVPEAVEATTPTHSAAVLTLDQCLKRALRNSKQIEAEKHRLAMIGEQQEQLWWLPLSNFSLEGGFSVVPDKCVDVTGGIVSKCGGEKSVPSEDDFKDKEWGPTFHIRFKGLLPIPTSNRYSKAKEALREAYKAKRAMIPSIEQQIAFNVHQAFHSVIGAREMRYTLKEGRKHLTKARKQVEENLEKQEGNDTAVDLLKLKVFESRLDAMETQINQIEKTALAAMNFLVGADPKHPIDLPEDPQDIIEKEIKPLETYKQTALKRRPEFEAIRHGVNALEAKIKIMKGAFAPELGVSVALGAGYTPGVRVLDENEEGEKEEVKPKFLYRNSYNYGRAIPSVALVMRMPLDFGENYHKVQEAKAALAAALADKSRAVSGILLEVETTYIEVTSLKETIDALTKSKKIAKGWLNASAQNHAIGLGSTKELKDALKEYFTIMGELLQKIAEYNIALAKLDKVTGVLINEKDIKSPLTP